MRGAYRWWFGVVGVMLFVVRGCVLVCKVVSCSLLRCCCVKVCVVRCVMAVVRCVLLGVWCFVCWR